MQGQVQDGWGTVVIVYGLTWLALVGYTLRLQLMSWRVQREAARRTARGLEAGPPRQEIP